jgi:exo-beta-1,3-glucanase (GH17 family)
MIEELEGRTHFSSLNTMGSLEALQTTPRFVSYAPTGWNPNTGIEPSLSRIRSDLKHLRNQGFTGIVTYTMDGVMEHVAKEAYKLGFSDRIVGVYAWDNAQKSRELKNLGEQKSYVTGVRVANEGILTGRLTIPGLDALVGNVKSTIGNKPVFISEPDGIYKVHPELYNIGDAMFVNVHPVWANYRDVNQAIQYTKDQVAQLKSASGKKVVLSESWWPSAGGTGFSQHNQTLYTKGLMNAGLMQVFGEAYDQYWKTGEGAFGTHWGINSSSRSAKEVVGVISPVVSRYNGTASLSKGVLTIKGTNFGDVIGATYDGSQVKVQVNKQRFYFPSASVKKIVAYGKNGNDKLTFSTMKKPCYLSGGSGNDYLVGGYGNDTLNGGTGKDSMYGRAGSNRYYRDAEDSSIYYNSFDNLEAITSGKGKLANSSYSFVEGVKGKGVVLSNSNFVTITNALTKNMNRGKIEFYFKPYTPLPSFYSYGIMDLTDSKYKGGWFSFFGDEDSMRSETGIGGADQTLSFGLKLNKWNHVVFSWDNKEPNNGTTITLNGHRDYTVGLDSYLARNSEIHVGKHWWYSSQIKIGFDEFKISDK